MPASHPATKAVPFELAWRLTSMSTSATIGMGLTSTPTAIGRDSPIASPMARLQRRPASAGLTFSG